MASVPARPIISLKEHLRRRKAAGSVNILAAPPAGSVNATVATVATVPAHVTCTPRAIVKLSPPPEERRASRDRSRSPNRRDDRDQHIRNYRNRTDHPIPVAPSTPPTRFKHFETYNALGEHELNEEVRLRKLPLNIKGREPPSKTRLVSVLASDDIMHRRGIPHSQFPERQPGYRRSYERMYNELSDFDLKDEAQRRGIRARCRQHAIADLVYQDKMIGHVIEVAVLYRNLPAPPPKSKPIREGHTGSDRSVAQASKPTSSIEPAAPTPQTPPPVSRPVKEPVARTRRNGVERSRPAPVTTKPAPPPQPQSIPKSKPAPPPLGTINTTSSRIETRRITCQRSAVAQKDSTSSKISMPSKPVQKKRKRSPIPNSESESGAESDDPNDMRNFIVPDVAERRPKKRAKRPYKFIAGP